MRLGSALQISGFLTSREHIIYDSGLTNRNAEMLITLFDSLLRSALRSHDGNCNHISCSLSAVKSAEAHASACAAPRPEAWWA
jgi:hypothetical protein